MKLAKSREKIDLLLLPTRASLGISRSMNYKSDRQPSQMLKIHSQTSVSNKSQTMPTPVPESQSMLVPYIANHIALLTTPIISPFPCDCDHLKYLAWRR